VLFDLVREQNRYGTWKQHARALVRDFLATFAPDADAGSAVVDIDVDWLIEEREEHRRQQAICGRGSHPRRVGGARRHPRGLTDRRALEAEHSLTARGFDEDQLAAAEPLRDRACPVDLGVRVAARVVDGLDVYAGDLRHAASS
jgi:hypothetical protein